MDREDLNYWKEYLGRGGIELDEEINEITWDDTNDSRLIDFFEYLEIDEDINPVVKRITDEDYLPLWDIKERKIIRWIWRVG